MTFLLKKYFFWSALIGQNVSGIAAVIKTVFKESYIVMSRSFKELGRSDDGYT